MIIAIAQLNCVVGDLVDNACKIFIAAEQAKASGAALLLTPELSLCGYPPEDLLLRQSFLEQCRSELMALAKKIRGIAVIVGFPAWENGRCYNAAALLQDGQISGVYYKQRLPNYTVFDEQRYFTPGEKPYLFSLGGLSIGLLICEDAWYAEPAAAVQRAGAQLLVVINGSPFHTEQQALRRRILQQRASETGLPMIYVNRVGGQDELVFDGASLVANGEGDIVQSLPAWHETLALVVLQGNQPKPVRSEPEQSLEAQVYQALCLGVKDYVEKNRFPGVILGLSGGIDSALTLAIAVDALGKKRVRAVMLPSRFNAAISLEDARTMAQILDVRYDELSIEPIFQAFLHSLEQEFKGMSVDATEENIQARIRGTLLMALSNKHGVMVLTTGNKSEMAVGYATLYGDMAGGFAVLKDISKSLVYRLAHYRNSLGRVIPERIIERAPSAELRADQTDQDSLPPYEILDAILEAYVEQDRSPAEIVQQGFSIEQVQRVVRLIQANEYKRRQAAVGIRITSRGFGKDWRYPITCRYKDQESI